MHTNVCKTPPNSNSLSLRASFPECRCCWRWQLKLLLFRTILHSHKLHPPGPRPSVPSYHNSLHGKICPASCSCFDMCALLALLVGTGKSATFLPQALSTTAHKQISAGISQAPFLSLPLCLRNCRKETFTFRQLCWVSFWGWFVFQLMTFCTFTHYLFLQQLYFFSYFSYPLCSHINTHA